MHTPVQHTIQRQLVLLVLVVANGDDFLETLDQYSQDQQGQCYGAQVNDEPKPSYHDEGEDASSPPFSPTRVHLAQYDSKGAPAPSILVTVCAYAQQHWRNSK